MNFEDIKVRSEKPYPELTDVKEDKFTVAILKNLATSRVGEIGATLQYVYQSVVADKVNMDIAEIFEEIAVVEMEHLDILMHAITEYGGTPTYEDANGNIFNASTINYSTKLKDMLETNIKAESFVIEQYENAIKKVGNQSLKELFARIIEDENIHLEVFKQIKDSVQFFSV